jgi:hypothetical protein
MLFFLRLIVRYIPVLSFFILFFKEKEKLSILVKINIIEPRHDKTNIMGSAQCDQDPSCSLTNPITRRETESEQHGS